MNGDVVIRGGDGGPNGEPGKSVEISPQTAPNVSNGSETGICIAIGNGRILIDFDGSVKVEGMATDHASIGFWATLRKTFPQFRAFLENEFLATNDQWLARYAELLGCDAQASVVAVRIQDLLDESDRQRKTIAQLRRKKESENGQHTEEKTGPEVSAGDPEAETASG